jgi:tetratricopeptide (TPR) repeat protein
LGKAVFTPAAGGIVHTDAGGPHDTISDQAGDTDNVSGGAVRRVPARTGAGRWRRRRSSVGGPAAAGHHDDHANVANLIGYSYRKLGDYRLSQIWYERALKADPNHVLTWQYYGLWQIEQGNRDSAQYHLSRIAAICGTACEEYRSLAAALEKAPGTGLVY